MKKLIITIAAIITTLSISWNITFAQTATDQPKTLNVAGDVPGQQPTTSPGPTLPQGITVTKPSIIPDGTNSKTTAKTKIPTLKLPGVGTDNTVQGIVLPTITNIIIGLTAGLSLLFTIVSGIQILTAFGNDDGLGKGKKTLTWSLIGLLISLLSYAIVQIIISIKIV